MAIRKHCMKFKNTQDILFVEVTSPLAGTLSSSIDSHKGSFRQQVGKNRPIAGDKGDQI